MTIILFLLLAAVTLPGTLELLLLTLGGLLLWFLSKHRRPARWPAGCLIFALAAVMGAWHHCDWRLFSPRDLGLRATEVPRPVPTTVGRPYSRHISSMNVSAKRSLSSPRARKGGSSKEITLSR